MPFAFRQNCAMLLKLTLAVLLLLASLAALTAVPAHAGIPFEFNCLCQGWLVPLAYVAGSVVALALLGWQAGPEHGSTATAGRVLHLQ